MVKAPYAKLYSIIKTQTMSADSEQCDEVGISSILGYILHEKTVHHHALLIRLKLIAVTARYKASMLCLSRLKENVFWNVMGW